MLDLREHALIPSVGQIALVIAPSVAGILIMEMIAELALKRQVIILDGGNRFDGYKLARALRRRTTALDAALKQVLLSRAFTCYQMLSMLSELPAGKHPIIVLDMLATFLDEDVKLHIRQRLLDECLAQLQRLSQSTAIVIWARKRTIPGVTDKHFMQHLLDAAHKTWYLEQPQPEASQLSLF